MNNQLLIYIKRVLQVYALTLIPKIIMDEDLDKCIAFYESEKQEEHEFEFCISQFEDKFIMYAWTYDNGDYETPPSQDLEEICAFGKLTLAINNSIKKYNNVILSNQMLQLQHEYLEIELPNNIDSPAIEG